MSKIFNWETYRDLNPDLTRAGLRKKQDFERHYIMYGKREKRPIQKPINNLYNKLNHYLINNNYTTFNDLQINIFIDININNTILNVINTMNDLVKVDNLDNCDLAILSINDENIIKKLGLEGKFVFVNYNSEYPNTIYYESNNIAIMLSKIYYFVLNRHLLKDILINSMNSYINNTDRTKTYVYVPVWGRHDLLKKCIDSIQNQTEQCDIVCLCSNKIDLDYVKSIGVLGLLTLNKPLSQKFQIGIDFGKVFYPKNVIIMGSDDIMTSNYVQNINKYISDYDVVGLKTWKIIYNNQEYTCKYNHKLINGYWGGLMLPYNNKLCGFSINKIKSMPQCIGAGRSIGYKLLNKMNWNIYLPNISKFLDTTSLYKMLIVNSAKHINLDTFDYHISCLKSNTEMISSFQSYFNAPHVICKKI